MPDLTLPSSVTTHLELHLIHEGKQILRFRGNKNPTGENVTWKDDENRRYETESVCISRLKLPLLSITRQTWQGWILASGLSSYDWLPRRELWEWEYSLLVAFNTSVRLLISLHHCSVCSSLTRFLLWYQKSSTAEVLINVHVRAAVWQRLDILGVFYISTF